jgi:hypothetical protein
MLEFNDWHTTSCRIAIYVPVCFKVGSESDWSLFFVLNNCGSDAEHRTTRHNSTNQLIKLVIPVDDETGTKF